MKRGWGSLCARCKGNLLASAGWAPYVQQQVAMALVNRSFLEEKEHDFAVEYGTERLACHMEKLPFYKTIQRY